MDPNTPNYFGMLAGFGILAFVIWLVVTALIVWLAIWIQYTIVWKAVRRGMREFHYGSKDGPQQISGYTAPPTQ
ncbi:MAG: hypothetical protein J0H56_12265 [Micrococcales bacterium]|nr:hypothetical protein [Micrococcales bacterium]